MLDINNQPIDPIWAAEFRGFFCGEGFIGIVSWGYDPKGTLMLRPRIQITSRSDEAYVLLDIQSKLGGLVYQEHKGRISNDGKGNKYVSNPYTVWRVVKSELVSRILDILSEGVIPFRKREQVSTLREFLLTVPSPGKRLLPGDREKRLVLYEALKNMHKYSE